MTSLYELAGNYKAIEQKLLDSEASAQTIADTLEGVAGEVEEKCINVTYVIRNLESSADQIKQAEKAMAERRKVLENKAAQLNNYLLTNMQRTGITKVSCPFFDISIANNPPAVVIDDEDAINDKFKKTVTTTSLDKVAIKEAIKAGESVDGAHLESGVRLVIK